MTTYTWCKSSYSGAEGGNCIEWAPSHAVATGTVPVRDSKVPTGPVMLLSTAAFAGLVAMAKEASL